MESFANSAEMFAQSLGLKEPWRIERAEFNGQERAVHIYVSARKTAKYACPICGAMCKRYDDEEECVWRHGDVVFFPCYVHCRRPRVECETHNIHVVTAPWARKGSRFTMLFESYAMLLLSAMTVNEARKVLRISGTALTHIMRYWVSHAEERQNLSDVKMLHIDETSFKRGQSYVTVIIDGASHKVIDVEEGRDATTVERFSTYLDAHKGDSSEIERVTCDMSGAYKSGVSVCFPNAKRTIDKFHVKKLLLDALNKVRIEEQGRQAKRRDAGRKLLMIPEARMTEEQRAKMDTLSKAYPKTGRAFRMVQSLDEMYSAKTIAEGKTYFDKLCRWMRRSRLEPMKVAAQTLKENEWEILNYFAARLTNAVSEGLNSLIQAAKRKARGFRTYEGFRCMIMLLVGRLKPDCIPLFE
ncbi:MAG: ISL3 family transposase [Christensenellales bacterium]